MVLNKYNSAIDITILDPSLPSPSSRVQIARQFRPSASFSSSLSFLQRERDENIHLIIAIIVDFVRYFNLMDFFSNFFSVFFSFFFF